MSNNNSIAIIYLTFSAIKLYVTRIIDIRIIPFRLLYKNVLVI
jgi:hypothetical protein